MLRHVEMTEDMIFEQLDFVTHNSKESSCYCCGKRGHIKRQCPERKIGHRNANTGAYKHDNRDKYMPPPSSNQDNRRIVNRVNQYEEGNKGNKNERIVEIKEIGLKVKPIQITVEINGIEAAAIIDIEASNSFMSMDLAIEKGLTLNAITTPIKVIIGNGTRVEIKEETNCRTQLDIHQGVSYDTSYLIKPNSEEPINPRYGLSY